MINKNVRTIGFSADEFTRLARFGVFLGGSFLTSLCLPVFAFAQTVTSLPVYEVVQIGTSDAVAARLSTALQLRKEGLQLRHGIVSFIDADRYVIVPHKEIDNPLPGAAPGERYQSIDFDAVRRIASLSDEDAIKKLSSAFATAGVNLPKASRPVVNHTMLTASYTTSNGSQDSVDQRLDTRVSYNFMLGDRYPLIGPGAQASASFGPDGSVTHLHLASLALRPGAAVHVIPEADVRAKLSRSLPPNARVDLKLIYWAPSLESTAEAASLKAVIPWYSVSVSTRLAATPGRVERWIRSKTRLIPATDDERYVPSAHLKVAGENSSRVSAAVVVTGGHRPYTYLWSGSNPELLHQSGENVSYTPIFRSVQRSTVATHMEETVSVTVIDANGVMTHETQVIGVQSLPVAEDHPVSKGGEGSYGTESPREPDFAIDRVGWQTGMAKPGGGAQRYAWLGNLAWPGDFIEASPKGSLPAEPWINGDADYSNWGINTAVIVLNNTDGDADGFDSSNPGAVIANYATAYFSVPADPPTVTVGMVNSSPVASTKSANVSYKGAWGPTGPNDHLLWLAMDACDTLDTVDGAGLKPQDRWGQAFGGLHILLGWDSEEQVGDGSFEQNFAENMLGVSGAPQQVLQAWLNAATTAGSDHGTAAALGPIGPGGITNQKDFYPGKGSTGPTILPANITGWWYIHQ